MKHAHYLLGTLLVAGLFSTQALADGIRASLTLSKTNFTSAEDIKVQVTLTNEEAVPVRVLKWYTPAEGVEEALFKVSVNGVETDYLGAHYKRPAAQQKDYIQLKSGQSVSYEVELSSLYDLSKTGQYEISYHAESYTLFTNNPGQDKKLARLGITGISSAPVSFYLEAKQGSITTTAKPGDGGGTTVNGVTFTGRCSNTQQTSILAGLAAAKTMSADAKNYLTSYSSPSSSVRYKTWFGNYDAGRWSTVRGNFNNIDSALNTQPLTFDCSCKKSYFAYVYPTQPYKVYLCNAFWTAPTSGTDSKGGTIVHELSHFNVVAGTDDLAYGHSAAKSLAISNPAQAVQNADSHEYFAENTPAQN
ncbi:MAG TPA: peptidase M35 [Rheinheimera sp.]|uniref:M35 family metallo-endopeptidase n=1 Tax=Rheinheimera sp. TaxID=1869214 RepID=UPI000ED2096E|nr:M35 family metallo-endopeptidase [Rheinheimera sp.]HCU65679.1 peptidase M35 [Rheinheimera sp.]